MVRSSLLALALAAGVLCPAAADAAIAVNDDVRARLVERPDGRYQVVISLARLTDNDRLRGAVRDVGLLRLRSASAAVRRLELVRGGGGLRVVITLGRHFGRTVLRTGSARTAFDYRIKDACGTRSCGGPGFSRARVRLAVLSPN